MMGKQFKTMTVLAGMLLMTATFTFADTSHAEADRIEVKQGLSDSSKISGSSPKSKIRNRKNKTNGKNQGPKRHKWSSKLIESIIEVESKGDKKAYSRGCAGLMQISKSAVRDANEWLRMNRQKKRFTMSDRFNKEKSIEIFEIEQERYNKEHSVEKAIRIWNGGHNSARKKTDHYYKKVMKAYNRK